MTVFCSGTPWHDTEGKLIQAHGGGVLFCNGVYYWYGEDRDSDTQLARHRTDVVGMSCYSSSDLFRWRNEELVLPAVPSDSSHDLPGTFIFMADRWRKEDVRHSTYVCLPIELRGAEFRIE